MNETDFDQWVLLTDAVRGAAEVSHAGQDIRRWARRLEVDTSLDVHGRLTVRQGDAVTLADFLDRRLIRA